MIIAVIQARFGSSRLPGKILAEVMGHPMIWHIVQRLRAARQIDNVVLATSDTTENASLRNFAKENGIPCFAGSEVDLIDRLYKTAQEFEAEALVRITGDCPLADPEIIDTVVGKYRETPYDYVSNILPRTFPDGLDTELYPLTTLEKLWKEIKDTHFREWFPTYFWKHLKGYRISNVENPVNLSRLRWTLDYPEDLCFVREIYQRLYYRNPLFGMREILSLLEMEPGIEKLNEKYVQ